MPIMQGDKDVTQEIMDRAEALRVGPRGTRQKQAVLVALTNAIVSIDQISRPWLDDCVYDTILALKALQSKIRELSD